MSAETAHRKTDCRFGILVLATPRERGTASRGALGAKFIFGRGGPRDRSLGGRTLIASKLKVKTWRQSSRAGRSAECPPCTSRHPAERVTSVVCSPRVTACTVPAQQQCKYTCIRSASPCSGREVADFPERCCPVSLQPVPPRPSQSRRQVPAGVSTPLPLCTQCAFTTDATLLPYCPSAGASAAFRSLLPPLSAPAAALSLI
jgi:hypothetical protein